MSPVSNISEAIDILTLEGISYYMQRCAESLRPYITSPIPTAEQEGKKGKVMVTTIFLRLLRRWSQAAFAC